MSVRERLAELAVGPAGLGLDRDTPFEIHNEEADPELARLVRKGGEAEVA